MNDEQAVEIAPLQVETEERRWVKIPEARGGEVRVEILPDYRVKLIGPIDPTLRIADLRAALDLAEEAIAAATEKAKAGVRPE